MKSCCSFKKSNAGLTGMWKESAIAKSFRTMVISMIWLVIHTVVRTVHNTLDRNFIHLIQRWFCNPSPSTTLKLWLILTKVCTKFAFLNVSVLYVWFLLCTIMLPPPQNFLLLRKRFLRLWIGLPQHWLSFWHCNCLKSCFNIDFFFVEFTGQTWTKECESFCFVKVVTRKCARKGKILLLFHRCLQPQEVDV